jgi:quinoprotein glucose dehydrogenase
MIDNSKNDGMFTPIGLTDTMSLPGNAGGANWGNSAADGANGILVVTSMDFPTMLKLLDPSAATEAVPAGAAAPANPNLAPPQSPSTPGVTQYFTRGFGYMNTSLGVPPITPPWSTLTAYDLNKGAIKWQIPLGDVPELAAKGIHNTGAGQMKSGAVITAGGLVFTATRDHFVRAYDEQTGKVLWEKQLDHPLQGIPVIYEAGGREYLVVCAAGAEVSQARGAAPAEGAYVAFALPRVATPKH